MPKQPTRSSISRSKSVHPSLRRVIQQTVRPEHIAAITQVLIYKSLHGDLTAIKELHEWLWGRDTVNLELNAGTQPVPVRINFGPPIKDGQEDKTDDPSAGNVESRVLPTSQ